MLAALLVLAAVTIVTPGQDTAPTIKNTLAGVAFGARLAPPKS